jgi:hypothetical protein
MDQEGRATMSTIRRHGVAFHLIPIPGEGLWLEVIRESDGAVLVGQKFTGESDEELAPAVEEWVDDIVNERVSGIEVSACRLCGARRRPIQDDEHGRVLPDYLVEWEFDLCLPCASEIEHTSPWMRAYIKDRYFGECEEDD